MKKNKKDSGSTPAMESPTEHQIQCAVIDFCALKGIPIFAIPNGGDRHVAVAVKLKKEGVKSGVPDLFIPVIRPNFGGMFLEMKRKGGKLSDVQKFWLNQLEEEGYRVKVAFSVDEAIKAIEDYTAL